ncbi:MAG: deoxyhypusine synthase [Candidatus Aenigmarchaeota archaeon]|nr:deoxyhypusine synthase [Candidatus Aenigmarchaeota archaeon]
MAGCRASCARDDDMVTKKQLDRAHDLDFRKTLDVRDFVPVKGPDFSGKMNLEEFIDSFKATGFQATNLGIAVDLVRKMRKEKVKIVLTFTSNLTTSGIRDVIAFLAKNRHVDVLCTTGGGIEEDVLKCYDPFVLGHFDKDAKELYAKGMNRTGNIYVPDSIYAKFEKFTLALLERFYKRQLAENKILNGIELVKEMGKEINNESSFLYWAYKNNIPVFSPSILDGAIGDIVWFFKHQNPDFKFDSSEDIYRMNDMPLDAKETGVIALGAGASRHYVLNAHIFRGGTKYAVFVSSGTEWDGSTSSAKPDEAYTWGKIKLFEPFYKNSVEVAGDATIIFPLIVAGAFLD